MKRIFYLFVLLLCAKSLYAQGGFAYDSKTLRSEILDDERKYAIYLPPDYNTSERSYPVLYLLHPAGPRGTVPNQQGWINYGNLKNFMDNAIAKGEITPMIIVTPDANFGTKRISYYNDPGNDFNFEEFFFKEFIPYIEKTYRCRTEREQGYCRSFHGRRCCFLLCVAPAGSFFCIMPAECSYQRISKRLSYKSLS